VDLKNPKRFLLQRVGRFISWAAGLSLGSLFFGVLVSLIVLAIFVRTDFFQRNLKDRVVELSQKTLHADISYERAEVEVFRFFPKLSFYGVKLKDRKTDSEVDIERTSISISAFVSIPLLLFQKIYISSAEVEGLNYELTNTKILRDWIERVKPSQKGSAIPSAFSTRINEIRFKNFQLTMSLKKEDVLKRPVEGKFALRDFSVSFDGDEIHFEGDFPFQDLVYGPVKVAQGAISIKEGVYIGRTFSFGRFWIESGEDTLEVSGSIAGFEMPNFNIQGQSNITLEHYMTLPVKGKLSSEFRYQGIWKNGRGNLNFELKDGFFKTRTFKSVVGKFRFREAQTDVLDLSFEDNKEVIRGKGVLALTEAFPSRLQLEIQNLSLPKWLGMIGDNFSHWGGIVDGHVDLSGDVLRGRFRGSANLNADGYQIKSETGMLRYRAPVADIKTVFDFASWEEAKFQTHVTTSASEWLSNMRWDKQQFWIDWKGDTHGPMGTLFFFDIETNGAIEGFYGGPFKTMDLKIIPKLDSFKLNGHVFKNVRGQIDFDEKRQFVANPLTSDQFKVEGGFLFPRVGDSQFYHLDFQVRNADALTVLNALPQTRPWSFKPSGKIETEGIFHGSMDDPQAEGTIKVSNFKFGDEVLGRNLSSQFSFENGYFHASDIEFSGAKDAGVLRGDLLLSSARIESFNFKSEGLRLADWLVSFGIASPFQAKSDFALDYNARQNEASLKGKLYETTLGVQPQEDSSFSWKSTKNEFQGDFKFFGAKIVGEGAGPKAGAEMRWKVQSFDMAHLISSIERSGLRWLMNAQSTCSIKFPKTDNQLINSIPSLDQWSCRLNSQAASIERGNATLNRLEAFDLSIQKAPTQDPVWSSDKIVLTSGRQKLELSGRYQSPKNLRVRVEGRSAIESLSYILPGLSRTDGMLEVDGLWDASGYSGLLHISQGLLVFRENPILIRDIDATIRAQNSLFEIQNLSGNFREGSLSATGRLRLEGFKLFSLSLSAQLNGALVEPSSGIRFRATGPLFVRQDTNTGSVTGQLAISEGRYRTRINLRSDFAKMFAPEERKYQFYEKEASIYDNWKLDIALQTSEPFQVRNNVAEADIQANLKVVGIVRSPRVQGSMAAIRGRFNYFNRSFDLKTATAQFNNPDSNVPRYDIQSETEAGEYRIFLNLNGDANFQKITYASDPPLAEKQILSLISTGTPPSTADQTIQDDRTTSAAYAGISFITGQLQDTIESTLSSDFGIQRFQLYPSFYEETGKTELQLKVGTDLVRNRLSLNYSNYISANGGHLLELDLKLNRNVSLVGSWRDTQKDQKQNISGDLGGDILFRFEIQ